MRSEVEITIRVTTPQTGGREPLHTAEKITAYSVSITGSTPTPITMAVGAARRASTKVRPIPSLRKM